MRILCLILSVTLGAMTAQAATPSPGPSPSPTPAAGALPGSVWLNELLPNPTGSDTNEEWLELHNPTDQAVDLSGLRVVRPTGVLVIAVPAAAILPPRGYLHLSELTGSLINTGDTLRLLRDDLEIDRITYDTAPEGWSWARLTESEGVWTPLLTPGAANAVPGPTPEPTPEPAQSVTAPAAATSASAAAKPAAKKAATKKAAPKKPAAKASGKSLPKSGPGSMLYLIPLLAAAAYSYHRWIRN